MNGRSCITLFVALIMLQACLGGNKKNPDEEPVELERFDGMRVDRLWTARVGGGAEHLRLGLRPASDGTRVFAASHNGHVTGFDLVSGNRDWNVDTKLSLTAGPGLGEGLIVVGSADGEVVALEASNGQQRWRSTVPGEILAVPVIARNIVIIRAVNGRVFGLDGDNGTQLWLYEQAVPRLSLRGSGQPAAAADRMVAGFDNGRVVALRLRDGEELWQTPLAAQRGRTELERLSDIDSNVVIIGEEVYVAGFQSRAALLTLQDGRPIWAEDLSSAGGLAADWTALYTTAGDGVVYALDRATGTRLWQHNGLLRRGVTGPTAFGEAVVVGDFEGYLHWLSTRDGSLIGRARAGRSPIVNAGLAVGERLFVQDEAGTLHAFSMPSSTLTP